MLFRPKDGILWDTLMYEHDCVFHMYYLRMHEGNLGHATSTDLANWTEEKPISVSNGGKWYDRIALTGAILEKDGRFYYSVGNRDADGYQVYGFAVSDDLYNWEMVDEEPVIRVKGPHYDTSAGFGNAWRDPFFRKDEEGFYHAYLCAHEPDRGHHSTGAVVGHIRSKNLKDWEHLPPLAFLGDKLSAAECPCVFDIGDMWYLLFLDHGNGGMRWHTSGYEDSTGVYYMLSNHPDGPYSLPDNPMILGSGGNRQQSWSGRAIKIGDDWVMYSHMCGETAFANLKKIVRAGNSLRLEYYPVMDKLAISGPKPAGQPVSCNEGVWSIDGNTITGEAGVIGTSATVFKDESNFILEAEVTFDTAAVLGFALKTAEMELPPVMAWRPPVKAESAAVIRLDFQLQRAEIEILFKSAKGYGHSGGDMRNGDYTRDPDKHGIKLEKNRSYAVKIISRDKYYELYIDNELVLCKYLNHALTGNVELVVERGKAEFKNVKLTEIKGLQ